MRTPALLLGGQVGARVEAWNNSGFGLDNDDVFLLGRIWLYCHFFPGEFISQSGSDAGIDFVYLWFVYTF